MLFLRCWLSGIVVSALLLNLCSLPGQTQSQRLASPSAKPRQPPGWVKLLDQAVQYEASHDYRSAEKIYRQLLGQPQPSSMNNNMHQYIWLNLGVNLSEQGQLTEAIKVLQQLISLDDVNSHHVASANHLLEHVQKQLQEAQTNVKDGLRDIKADPNSIKGYKDLMTGLAAQGQAHQSISFLEQQLGYPLSPNQLLELARAAKSLHWKYVSNHIRNQRFDLSIELYQELVQRYPDHQPAQLEYLDFLALHGAPTAVISAYQDRIRRNPDLIWNYWQVLTRNLESAGRLEEARQIFDQLLQKKQTEPYVYLALGSFLERTKRPDEAVQVYFKAIQAFPGHSPSDRRCHVVKATAYDRLVTLLDHQHRLDQALSLFQQNLPNLTAAMYYNLGLALRYEGFQDLAAQVSVQMQTSFPQARVEKSSLC